MIKLQKYIQFKKQTEALTVSIYRNSVSLPLHSERHTTFYDYTTERTDFIFTVLSCTLNILLFTTLLILCFQGADYSPSPLQRGILHFYLCPVSFQAALLSIPRHFTK